MHTTVRHKEHGRHHSSDVFMKRAKQLGLFLSAGKILIWRYLGKLIIIMTERRETCTKIIPSWSRLALRGPLLCIDYTS